MLTTTTTTTEPIASPLAHARGVITETNLTAQCRSVVARVRVPRIACMHYAIMYIVSMRGIPYIALAPGSLGLRKPRERVAFDQPY